MSPPHEFTETADEAAVSQGFDGAPPEPGVLLVFSAGEPLSGALPLRYERGTAKLTVGRGRLEDVELRDTCMSREHASILEHDGTWTVKDHGSRNGTYVDGVRVTGEVSGSRLRVVRTGETVFLLCADLAPFRTQTVELREDCVIGSRMVGIMQSVVRAAQAGVLHVTGETGTGKEVVARAFHRFGAGPTGPFVAVNCATIPEGVAERLLFGAQRGAFSGADRDSRGYVQESDGGTLFLDEVGELDLSVQAKLLRVLETREVLPLGASRPTKVDLRLCSATHRDLRQAVAAGRFREDLFFRLGRPRVALPALRERPEEIPFLIDRQLRRTDDGLTAQAALIEACLLRHWPGNVRELLAEVRDAAFEARAAGKTIVKGTHLAEDAGREYAPVDAASRSAPAPAALPPRERIEEALRACGGRVTTAARTLGLHRNQLRRWLEKNGIDPQTFGLPG
jgi:transcriptional regulator of acetoin/glycerol metabolism